MAGAKIGEDEGDISFIVKVEIPGNSSSGSESKTIPSLLVSLVEGLIASRLLLLLVPI